MRLIQGICLLIFPLYVFCFAGESSRNNSFVIDRNRPFIDIAFHSTGKRFPVFPEESTRGLWLALRNNCTYTARVRVLNVKNQNEGALVAHEVMSASKYQSEMSLPPGALAAASTLKQPQGYGTGHTANFAEIRPENELAFSVPLEHVTRNWFIRVEVELELPQPKSGREPRIFVDYYWVDLPPEVQRLSDQLLSASPE
jgi:hypothetical protein